MLVHKGKSWDRGKSRDNHLYGRRSRDIPYVKSGTGKQWVHNLCVYRVWVKECSFNSYFSVMMFHDYCQNRILKTINFQANSSKVDKVLMVLLEMGSDWLPKLLYPVYSGCCQKLGYENRIVISEFIMVRVCCIIRRSEQLLHSNYQIAMSFSNLYICQCCL